jgi:hypothetical protein
LAWEPKIVKEGDSIDCLDLAQAMIDSPGIPNREKVPLIAILAQYTHVKPVGQYLSRSIVFEPPKTIDEALELRRKFMMMKYRRELTIEEADGLIADIDGHIAQMRGPDHAQRIEAMEARWGAQDAESQIAVLVEGGLGAFVLVCDQSSGDWGKMCPPIDMPRRRRFNRNATSGRGANAAVEVEARASFWRADRGAISPSPIPASRTVPRTCLVGTVERKAP